MESEWVMFKASIAEEAARSCGEKASPEAADRYWEARRAAASAVAKAKTRVWEEFGEAMEKDFRLASRKFWGGELLTQTGDIVRRWKEHFEGLLNPTNTCSGEEAQSEDLGEASPISLAEVSEVVRKLLSSKAPGKFIPGCWKGGSDRLSNLSSRRNNVDVEQWTSSLFLQDDVVLSASSDCNLQHALGRFAAECEAVGMRVSTFKAEAMVLCQKPVDCSLGSELLPQAKEYLGVLYTSEGKMEHEMDGQIDVVSAVMRALYQTVVKKELIFILPVDPTLTYDRSPMVSMRCSAGQTDVPAVPVTSPLLDRGPEVTQPPLVLAPWQLVPSNTACPVSHTVMFPEDRAHSETRRNPETNPRLY
ncbi:hypothetical protein N1851_018576 [Merluccius polli]|uniref:Uncharacterized protein n=1 Tax=Merluccius polli TaxID=89951 RepID=A0AA47MMR9_MERPO|nr:hypothetical protein N1851_018576 [Merluccius polli]